MESYLLSEKFGKNFENTKPEVLGSYILSMWFKKVFPPFFSIWEILNVNVEMALFLSEILEIGTGLQSQSENLTKKCNNKWVVWIKTVE